MIVSICIGAIHGSHHVLDRSTYHSTGSDTPSSAMIHPNVYGSRDVYDTLALLSRIRILTVVGSQNHIFSFVSQSDSTASSELQCYSGVFF